MCRKYGEGNETALYIISEGEDFTRLRREMSGQEKLP